MTSVFAGMATSRSSACGLAPFSAEATAFSAVDLWGTGQAADYLATVHEEAGDQILRDLLEAARPGPAGDEVFTDHGLKILVDNPSLPYVRGAVVDYVESLQGAGFKVENPNIVAACGCGSSFRVADEEEVSAV